MTAFGTHRGDSGHFSRPLLPLISTFPGCRSRRVMMDQVSAKRILGDLHRCGGNHHFLVCRLKLVALHFPLDAHEPIEMHGLGFEPALESFAGIGAKFDEHFSFEHVDENTLGASGAASLHALRENFGALAREAGERVLREIAGHRNSSMKMKIPVFHRRWAARMTGTGRRLAAKRLFKKNDNRTTR